MRTTARTAAFIPGESPPEVMTAIFFLGAIFVVFDNDGESVVGVPVDSRFGRALVG
jgi:hypothetical protein